VFRPFYKHLTRFGSVLSQLETSRLLNLAVVCASYQPVRHRFTILNSCIGYATAWLTPGLVTVDCHTALL
jgi:hypothetical protein